MNNPINMAEVTPAARLGASLCRTDSLIGANTQGRPKPATSAIIAGRAVGKPCLPTVEATTRTVTRTQTAANTLRRWGQISALAAPSTQARYTSRAAVDDGPFIGAA